MRRGDRGDRRGAVAVREAYTEIQRPGFRAGTSSSIHTLPPLARGPTGKAVLALEVRTRTLRGHAPWTPVRVLRGGIGGKLKCGFCVLSVPAAVGHRFMSILTHPDR